MSRDTGRAAAGRAGSFNSGKNQPAQALIALKSLVPGAVPVSAVTGLVQVHRTGPVPLHRLTPTLYPASLLVLVAGQRLL